MSFDPSLRLLYHSFRTEDGVDQNGVYLDVSYELGKKWTSSLTYIKDMNVRVPKVDKGVDSYNDM